MARVRLNDMEREVVRTAALLEYKRTGDQFPNGAAFCRHVAKILNASGQFRPKKLNLTHVGYVVGKEKLKFSRKTVQRDTAVAKSSGKTLEARVVALERRVDRLIKALG